MYIKPFAVEEWMNEYEVGARFNIAETCVDSVSLDRLFALAGEDKARFLADFCAKRLTYGDILGSPALRSGICGLYKTVQPDQVVPTHGAAGANHHVFCSLISAGDRVVSIMPTWAVSMPKLSAISDNRPTGANSVVLKINAAMANVTTRSHATLRETVFVVISSGLVIQGKM